MAETKRGPRAWSQAMTGVLRQRILDEADPIDFLAKVLRGDPFLIGDETVVPTLSMRTDVAMELIDKIVPDLKATEVTLGGDADGAGDGESAFDRLVGRLGRAALDDGARPTTH